MAARSKIEVRKVRGMGRGVFATGNFKFNEVIESCHVILFDQKDGAKNNPTQAYSFRWAKDKVAISLGNGSLYNHDYEPNAYVMQDKPGLRMIVYALRPIQKGEQIFINYNGEPECTDALWFDT